MARDPELFRRSATIATRLLVIALAVGLAGWVLWTLRLALLPVFVAALLCTALAPLVVRLERRGWPPAAAAGVVFGGFIVALVAIGLIIIPPTVSELGSVGDSVRDGVQSVEDWLVDGPLGLDRAQVEQFSNDPVDSVSSVLGSTDLSIASGALVLGEALAGALLALVLTFLLLKDGRRFQDWTLRHLPRRHREPVTAAAQRAWEALGGYLRGAAILGAVEGFIIGTSVWVVGGALAIPVAVLTFVAAFFPIVGAVVAGAVATLVVLATAGVSQAVIVLVVVVVVQQLDNDILAPFIFGRSVSLHPAVILVALTVGGSLGGIVGAFIAVPLTAVVAAVAAEVWERRGRQWTEEVAVPAGAGAADPVEPPAAAG